MWRIVPMYRVEADGDRRDLPRPVPPEHRDDRLGPFEDGIGPLLHRRYWVTTDRADGGASALIGTFASDPNRGAPAEVAEFLKTRGTNGALRVGDEFVVRMPGPWDGPVRVIAATPTSLRLATLRGHLEAGQIEFSAREVDDGVVFQIESWARAADRLSHLLYNRLGLAKEIQLNLWVETCLRVTRLRGGRPRGGVHVDTRRVNESDLPVRADQAAATDQE
jgi:hypothetical protein